MYVQQEVGDILPVADMRPVNVTVIGTGGGPAPILATTPELNQPDILIRVVSPIMAIAVRFTHSYLTTLVGLYSAAVVSDAIPASGILDLIATCATLSLAGPILGLMKDGLLIFGRLESRFPLITGNV